MAFRNDEQKAGVCIALLARAGVRDQWTPFGPEPTACAVGSGTPLPVKTLLGFCWSLWEGTSAPAVRDLLALPGDQLQAVGSLMTALGSGSDAVDQWIEREERSCGKENRS